MQQVLIIHGGSSFDSYERYLDNLRTSSIHYDRLKKSSNWHEWIANELNEADVLLPDFPNKQNASYTEWQIYFEKILPFLNDDVSLVGHSLGAMFLAKYLHTTPLSSKIKHLILVAPIYDNTSLEDLGSFRIESATNLRLSCEDIHLFHSEDDPISPYSELAKFHRDIPNAHVHTFTNRNHFLQPTFPELLDILKQK